MAENVARLGLAPYQAAVDALGIDYAMAPNPLELSVVAGRGEAAGDQKRCLRDVPCRAACPARTNVPEYIRLIAQGDFDAAHRINQEDNVFPGVLGRICTRPCEIRCRHQWTNTRGPVSICSPEAGLRRRQEPAQPAAAAVLRGLGKDARRSSAAGRRAWPRRAS